MRSRRMDSARWERVQALFHDAVDLPPDERPAFLRTACGADTTLMSEVLAAIAEDDRGSSLLDRDWRRRPTASSATIRRRCGEIGRTQSFVWSAKAGWVWSFWPSAPTSGATPQSDLARCLALARAATALRRRAANPRQPESSVNRALV